MATKIDRGIAALLTGWLNSRQLAEVMVRANGNACVRDVRASALRRGLAYHYADVNHQENDIGSDHRLHHLTAPGQALVPLRAAIYGKAWIWSEYPEDEKPTLPVPSTEPRRRVYLQKQAPSPQLPLGGNP